MLNESKTDVVRACSFLAVIKTDPAIQDALLPSLPRARNKKHYSVSSIEKSMELAFSVRNADRTMINVVPGRQGQLLLGDDAEWSARSVRRNMAYAVSVEYDLDARRIKIMTSIVGLPPVYLYTGPGMVIITSDVYLLSTVPGVQLYFDPDGVNDFTAVGHPIEHRTLFQNVRVIPAGHSARINSSGEVNVVRSWQLPQREPFQSWDEYIDVQSDAFTNAMHSIDLVGSFLSLTAGLDTRAILTAMIQMNKKISAYTMTGRTLSLDARIARNLCRGYGLKHTIIMIGDAFFKDLPAYSAEASRLSGGLVSLGQAHEVYFYRQIQGAARARLSGNLGNQVGRRGVEKVSLRNADISIVHEEFINKRSVDASGHWYAQAQTDDGSLDFEFLLQHEIPFSSAGNYCLGNHFAVQQSPYSNVGLIEVAQCRPMVKNQRKSPSLLQVRLHDLRHRFLGESEHRSFQVNFIKHAGGYAASCPINWGWRTRGGISLVGGLFGWLAFVDALAAAKGLDSGVLYQGLQTVHIAGLHEYTSVRAWLKSYLQDFVYHTLMSPDMKQSGLFNVRRLQGMLDEHYSSRRSHYKELALALDLALARQAFHASIK